MVDAGSEADQEISGGVLAVLLDNSGEEREGEGAGGRGGGFLELQLGQQLPVTEMLCGVQLLPYHDPSALLLSSSCAGFFGGDHGSHGDGHLF